MKLLVVVLIVQVMCAGAVSSDALVGHTQGQIHTYSRAVITESLNTLSMSSWTSASTIAIYVCFCLIYVCLATLVAHYYHTRPKTGVEFEQKDFTAFHSGLFNIFDDMNICLWSFMCMPIRWAENTSLIGLMGFFTSFFLCMIGCGISEYIVVTWLFMIVLFTVVRYKFRQSFHMQTGCELVCTDCLSYAFCCWCATAQDARHVDAALVARNPAVSG